MVLYIIGDRRSGTTLLDYLLSRNENCFSVGEMSLIGNFVNKIGAGSACNYKCTCGKSVEECDFWAPIIESFLKVYSDINVKYSNIKPVYLIRKFFFDFSGLLDQIVLINKSNNDKNILLYSLIKDNFEPFCIIDSSKNVEKASSLSRSKEIDIGYIYIEKEMFGVVKSKIKWLRKRGNKANNIRVLVETFFVRFKNRIIVNAIKNKKIFKVKYMDIVEGNREKVLKSIFNYFEIPCEEYVFPDVMDMNGCHNIAGTGSRFEGRPIKKYN